MLPVLIIVGLVVIIGGIGLYNRQQMRPQEGSSLEEQNELPDQEAAEQKQKPAGVVEKKFDVNGQPFSFDPKEIKVKKGDMVVITFHNKAGMHDWVIDEFNTRTKQIKAGESETVSFVADKTGTFEYYCSVGNHRAMGMKGNLIVE